MKRMATRLCGLKTEQGERSSRGEQPWLQLRARELSESSLIALVIVVGVIFFVPKVSSQPTEARVEGTGDVSPAGASIIGKPPAHHVKEHQVQRPSRPNARVKCSNVGYFDTYDIPDSSCSIHPQILSKLDIVDNFYEYEEKCGVPGIKVRGRLKECFLFWSAIGAPEFILNTIKIGYVLPFIQRPPSMFSKNNKSALTHSDFVSEAISELVNLGTVEICDFKPTVVNPLTVSVQSNSKKRLILDLRLVNNYLGKSSVKYEDMRTALLFLKKGGFMFKFDLKSGYHHIDICPAHREFLGFSWPYDGSSESFFIFRQLPFGLSSAPFIFTKVIRPLVKKWRGEGKSIVVFLDDGLGFASTFSEAVRVSAEIKADLIASGFVPNVQKSVWYPTQQMEWLGYDIDLVSGHLSIPNRRIVSIKQGIQCILQKPQSGQVTARQVASVVGKIMSTSLVTGNIAKVMTKALHVSIESRYSWDSCIVLSSQALDELAFWGANVDHLNKSIIGHKAECSRIVCSDASGTGFGGYIVDVNNTVAHGQWTYNESQKSSAWRELKAVELVLKSLAHELSGRRTKWFTDNQSVEKIAVQGSMKGELQSIALSICQTCLRHNIHLEMEWIPRSKNERADKLSRIIDKDDWFVSDEFFQYFDALWGPHTVDRFASYYNTKITRFNSRFWNPGCEDIDAFSVDWKDENNWVVPPISIIPRVILFMEHTKAVGTLICPGWFSAPFWPLLFPDGYNPIRAVMDIYEIPWCQGMILPGRGCNEEFVNNIGRSKILAVRLNFKV